MSLTIAPSPFGSLVVSVAETGSTLSVTTVATAPAVLSMALGVPGPAGEQGEPGTNGTNGQGVAAGGLTNQVLVKLSNDDFATGWADGGAAGDFLPLSGGTMSGAILFDAVGGQNIAKGSFDSGRGGYNGISLNCANLYELNWQSGYLKNIYNNAVAPINVESDLVNSTIPDIDNQGTKSIFNSNGLSAIFYFGSENTLITNYGHSSIDHTFFDNPYNFHLNQNGVYGTGYDGDNPISWGIGIGGVTYPDATVQMTAFPPDGGLVTEYIDGTGALQTYGPLGDRYFTTSNSTLTCDSGNGKTMTIGTGLSYSRQQDITVSYNNSNHMHGTVLTYDSATGVMTFDANTHSGSGTYSSWEVNVGGVAGAILPVGGTSGQVLAKINSTNFNTEWVSLGSASTLASSALLQTENNLSDLSSSSTARTNLGLGSMATQSTSAFIGTSAYATNLQAVQNTSTSTVISPANSRFAGISTNIWSPGVTGLTATTSGTGASAGSTYTSLNGLLIAPNATTAGYATRGFSLYFPSNSVNSGYNYGTESGHSVKIHSTAWASTVTGVKMRAVFGRMSNVIPVPATLAARGYGWEWDYSTKVISIIAHNGSSLTTTAQTWTPVSSRNYDIAVYSNGAGTISLYIDGTLIGTGTGGPTTSSTTNQIWWQMEIENQATAGSQQTIAYSNPKLITTNG